MFKKLLMGLAFAGTAFAGQIVLDIDAAATTSKTPVHVKEPLTNLDSIRFAYAASGDYKDSLLVRFEGKEFFEKNSRFLWSWIDNIGFETLPEYDESMTVSVYMGAQEGNNTFLLKDVKSVDFIEIDEDLDSDGDGYTDVKELFIYGTDPNKKTYTGNTVLKFDVFSESMQKLATIARDESGSYVTTLDSISSKAIVVEAKLEEPAGNVTVTVDGNQVDVSKVDSVTYRFNMPPFKASTDAAFDFLVEAEIGGTAAKYQMRIPTRFEFSSAIGVGPSDDRQQIYVAFNPSLWDARVSGYAILRAQGSNSSNNANLESMNVDQSESSIDKILPTGVSVIKIIDNADIAKYHYEGATYYYADDIGGPSPYYTYRVVAYVKENVNGKDVYHYRYTNARTLRVGHIKFSFKAVEFGTEYFTVKALRSDMRLFADFYNGSSVTKKYNYWFKNAGVSLLYPNTFAWETKADEDNSDNNAVNIDTKQYTMDVGKDGVKLVLKNNADKNGTTVSASQTITWSYDNFVKVLNGQMSATGKSGNAPKKGRNVFTYGVGGVSYDDSCGSGCGDEPHAGWKFDFDYGWDD